MPVRPASSGSACWSAWAVPQLRLLQRELQALPACRGALSDGVGLVTHDHGGRCREQRKPRCRRTCSTIGRPAIG